MVEKRFGKLGMPDIERFENYLPTAFNSELTLLQKVNKIIFDLIETNKLTNEMVDYLNRFIETFDEKLYETLEDVLNVWLKDGRLADIVRVAISEEVIEARTDYLGKKYVNLKERLDSEKADVVEVTAQLAQIVINVQSFGALGDGLTDDSEAIQNAINFVEDMGGGKVLCPKTENGYFLGLPINVLSNVTLDGGGNYFQGDTSKHNYIHSCLIFVGVPRTSVLNDVHNAHLINAKFKGIMNSPTRPFQLFRSHRSSISKCSVIDSSDWGIGISKGTYQKVFDNYVENPNFHCITSGGGSEVDDTPDYYEIYNNHLIGNKIATGTYCLDVRVLNYGIVRDNKCVGVRMLKAQTDGSITIKDNHFIGVGGSATELAIWVASNYVVDGNVIENSMVPFYVTGSNNKITNNKVISSVPIYCGFRLYIGDLTDNTIENNTIDVEGLGIAFIFSDDVLYRYPNFKIINNSFKCGSLRHPSALTNVRYGVRFSNSENAHIINNHIQMDAPNTEPSKQRGMEFSNLTDSVVSGNTILMDSGDKGIRIVGESIGTIAHGNLTNNQFEIAQPQTCLYSGNVAKSWYPTSPQNDRPLTGVNIPTGNIVPRFIGDKYHRSSTPVTIYEAVGLTNSDWVLITT